MGRQGVHPLHQVLLHGPGERLSRPCRIGADDVIISSGYALEFRIYLVLTDSDLARTPHLVSDKGNPVRRVFTSAAPPVHILRLGMPESFTGLLAGLEIRDILAWMRNRGISPRASPGDIKERRLVR